MARDLVFALFEMAGYSGTPLPKKLGIKEGHRVWLSSAPDGFEKTLGALPKDAKAMREARGEVDVVLLFTTKLTDLQKRFSKAREKIPKDGQLWIAWPKKSSGVATDLTEDVIRAHGLAEKLVDNKVCAIDETWSGLRFMWRLKDR
jgi:hypothetical protein